MTAGAEAPVAAAARPDAPGPAGRARVPRLVVAATVALGLIGGLWAVLTPIAEGPDEPAHVGLVLHLAAGHGYPEHDGLAHQEGVVRLCRTYAASTRWCRTAAERADGVARRSHPPDAAPGRAGRERWGPAAARPVADRFNQMPQHPPAYYAAMAVVLRVERAVTGSSWPIDREVALLRLVNVALLVPLPLLAWWAARRGGFGDPVGAVAAVAVLAVPQLAATAGTVNSDNLLTLLAAVVVALAAGVARGDRRVRVALALGGLCGLALLTKAFGLVLPPVVAGAYLVGWTRARRDDPDEAPVPRWLGPAALAGLVALAVGAWWYVAKLVATGRVAPTIETRRLGPSARPEGFRADPIRFAGDAAELLAGRFWGSFGWFSVRLPLLLAAALTLAAGALVARGALAARAAADPPAGADAAEPDAADEADVAVSVRPGGGAVLVLLGPGILLLAFVLVRAWNLYVTSGQVAFLQGRYLFGGIVGLGVLAAAGAVRTVPRWAAPGMAGTAVALQLVSTLLALDGWWRVGGLAWADAGRALVAWGAWPAPLTLLLVALGLAAGPLLVATALRAASPPDEN